jgi:tRNA-dihydrouridine synthase B
MAAAAQIVEGMGADIVDVNMGCPVPKIAKHNAGCSLMREPEHAARVIGAMAKAVKIPVTVKMRAGWNDRARNAPALARMVEDAGAAAGRSSRADRGTELQRQCGLGSGRRGRRPADHSGLRQR